jgi:hypothetical protein
MKQNLDGTLDGKTPQYHATKTAQTLVMQEQPVFDHPHFGTLHCTGCFFNKPDGFTAQCFTATSAPLAAKCTRILSMTQHADNIWNEEKFLHLFTDHSRC